MSLKLGDHFDHWRRQSSSSNMGIFETIEGAIAVAAFDHPKEFALQRKRIAEIIFNLPECDNKRRSDCDCEMKKDSFYSFVESETLLNQIEEHNQVVAEVLKIKNIIANNEYGSDGMLFESLRKLQLMAPSIEILKATELEKAIAGLQKHNSTLIRDLVQKLINEWKNMKDEWHESAHQFVGSEVSHDSAIDEVWGLPSPPLDEGAFLMVAQTSTVDLSKIFNEIDDSGNVRDIEGLTENLKQKKKPQGKGKEMRILKRILKQTEPSRIESRPEGYTKLNSHHKVNEETENQKEAKNVSTKKEMGGLEDLRSDEASSKPSRIESRPEGYTKLSSDRKVNEETENQKEAKNVLTKKEMGGPEDLRSDEASLHLKFQCTKRKLHESYKQVENEKKQRRIQIIDFQNLPKEGNSSKNHHLRPKKFIQPLTIRQH